jgi:hypothetical protein
MSASNFLENAVLNHLRGSAYTVPAGLFVKLHTGDPGEDATGAPAAVTLRVAVTMGAAAAGAMVNTSVPAWTNYATAETISHISIWDAVTGGNPLLYGPVTTPKTMQVGDNLQFNAGALTVTAD